VKEDVHKAGGKVRRGCVIAVAVAIVLFVVVPLVVSRPIQRRFIFQNDRRPHREMLRWKFDDVKVEVRGETTHGWFVPLEDARGTVLFSHGNGPNISRWMHAIEQYRSLGVNVLIYDYGGYGLSTGKPSAKRFYADITAMWSYLTEERGIAPSEIVLVGVSLGGGPTVDLAARVSAAGVILESTFRSIPAMAREMGCPTWFPIGLLISERFDNESKIGGLTSPLLIAHSSDDTFVPYSHGERLFSLAPEPKRFLEMGGAHDDGHGKSFDEWRTAVDRFLIDTLEE
jgi:fermentation-respiration switch protein FrsA (DUF1100 family)